MSSLQDCRKAFAETLIELAEADARVVAVVNDSVGSSNLKEFKKRFPDRLVNVGIAEQNMVGVGAGLANGGMLPFVCGASCFLTGRALGTGQGGFRLQPIERQTMWNVEWSGLWGTWADSPFD